MDRARVLPSVFEGASLVAVLDSLRDARVLVLGDLILDRYTWGQPERVSPEAPVPILRFQEHEDRLGGAAAVAVLSKALGGHVTCLGMVGTDAAGETLLQLLGAADIDAENCHVDTHRQTTVKQRFLSRQHGHAQLLRLDCESREPAPGAVVAQWMKRLSSLISASDAILVSDYGKGVCSRSLLRAVIQTAAEHHRPVLVDPARGAQYSAYGGAMLMVPNRAETENATRMRIATPCDAAEAGSALCRRFRLEASVVKLDAQGLVLAFPNGTGQHFSTRPRAVFDITGAGDSVLAMLGFCLAQQVPLEQACQFANVAGGLQVERIGVAPITREDIRRDLTFRPSPELGGSAPNGWHHGSPFEPATKLVSLSRAATVAAEARSVGRRVVFTNGCFAAVHAGHVAYLREARSLGEVLIVAVNSAASIRRLKGECAIIPDADRLALLASLDFVDYVLLFEEDTPLRLIECIRPDFLVKGGTTESVLGRELVEGYGGVVRILSALPGVSTSDLLCTRRRNGMPGTQD